MTLIKKIQKHIEKIYGIRIGEAADDFVISTGELHELLPSSQNTALPRELFLVTPNTEEDAVEVALYFDESLKNNLSKNDPLIKISPENISDFCTLIEGVSHFVYYLYKAASGSAVTQLEMELQAEIDKFVLLSLFLETDADRRSVLDLLFENYYLFENLSPAEIERYETAADLAKKYCYSLSQMLKGSSPSQMLSELRKFYPLNHQDKIRHILM